METKHSKGPWEVIDNGIWDISVKAAGTVCHINNKGDWFPKSNGYVARSHNNMIADARLIAAAPELLAALHDCLAFLENDCPLDLPCAPEIRAARAAIAKATGDAE